MKDNTNKTPSNSDKSKLTEHEKIWSPSDDEDKREIQKENIRTQVTKILVVKFKWNNSETNYHTINNCNKKVFMFE